MLILFLWARLRLYLDPFFFLSSLILLSPGLLLNKSQGTFISFLICSIDTIAMISVLVVA